MTVLTAAAAPSDGAPAGDGGAQEMDVTAVDIAYEPTGTEVAAGTTMTFNVANEGAVEHDFQLESGEGTGLIPPGESASVELGPFEETAVIYCTVAGHREAGMEFEVTVN